MDFGNMDHQMFTVPQPRANKVYFTSPGDYIINGQLPQCFQGNSGPFLNTLNNFDNNIGQSVSSQNAAQSVFNGNFSPSSFSCFGNYPVGNFPRQPPIAVPNSPHPPPFNAHLGNNVTNPFSVSNLQTRPIISEGAVGSSAEQPSTSSSAPTPRHMDTIPIYQAVCNQI